MSTVSAGFSMSLDGFIAGPNDDFERLFEQYSHLGPRPIELESTSVTVGTGVTHLLFRVVK